MSAVLVVLDGGLDGSGAYPAGAMPALEDLGVSGAATLGCRTVPSGAAAGTEVGLGEILGVADAARGPVEAASRGLSGAWAWRLNVVRVVGGRLVEATPALTQGERAAALDAAGLVAGDGVEIVSLGGWRLVAVADREADPGWLPPHDRPGVDVPSAARLPVLGERVEAANDRLAMSGLALWPWGGGPIRYPRGGSGHRVLVCAAAVAVGLGRLGGWDVRVPPGATGDTDTDLAAKVGAVEAALAEGAEIAVCHVDGADAAAHRLDPEAKWRFLHRVDGEVVDVLRRGLGASRAFGILPDHATDPVTGRHGAGPVPLVITATGAGPGWGDVAASEVVPWLATGAPPRPGRGDLDAVLVDVGGTLVAESSPGTAVADLSVDALPGARDALEVLGRRYTLAAVTNTAVMRGPEVRALLDRRGLGHRLAEIVTSAEVGREKPDPAPVLEALRRLDVAPGRALFVGDRATDERAARGAGVSYLAVGERGLSEVVGRLLV